MTLTYTITILLIAIGFAAIGLVPTYARLVLLTPVVIVAARLLQCFA